jgi:hypothetical protein
MWSVGETSQPVVADAHSMAGMGQSHSGATSNNNALAALHSGFEQAHKARRGLDDVVGIVGPYIAIGAGPSQMLRPAGSKNAADYVARTLKSAGRARCDTRSASSSMPDGK